MIPGICACGSKSKTKPIPKLNIKTAKTTTVQKLWHLLFRFVLDLLARIFDWIGVQEELGGVGADVGVGGANVSPKNRLPETMNDFLKGKKMLELQEVVVAQVVKRLH